MKLTKNQETELMQVYDTWLHSYLNGDVKTYDSFFDDRYHFIGSTINEEFLNRKDTTKFFQDTADQLAGKSQLRNEKRIIEQFGELVIITHVFDAWFLNEDEWSYYGRFRFTSTLEEKKEGWRFIYQHFSTTDSKAEKGETIGFDQVSAENRKLREAIKRRTFELEEKNRDLEIETALERVRAVAMGMQNSEDLAGISESIFKELKTLGFSDLRNTEVIVNDDGNKSILSYYYSDYGVTGSINVFYELNPKLKKWAKELKNARDGFAKVEIKQDEIKNWRQYREDIGYIPDPSPKIPMF